MRGVQLLKEIKMFVMETCPHCRRACGYIRDLLATHPEYRDIQLTVIDENKEQELADQHDYYYVPTFYVGGEKAHEGVPTEEIIMEVFRQAYLSQ